MMTKETVPIEMPFGNYALEGISEISLPDPLPILPLAPAWKYVFIVLALWLFYVAVKKTVYWLNNRYRKQALLKLEAITQQEPSIQSVSAVGQLLKGTSLYVFTREQIASLTGKAWLEQLNTQAQTPVFDENSQTLLGASLYMRDQQAISTSQWQALIEQTTIWIKTHPYTGVKPIVKPIKLANPFLARGQQDA